MADESETIVPNFAVRIEGNNDPKSPKADVSRFVQSVEYEFSDELSGMAKVTLADPDHKLSESKLFLPYNHMSVWMGWGKKIPTYLGRVILAHPRKTYPEDGMPMLEVTGYTRDFQHAMKAPDPDDKEGTRKQKGTEKKFEITFKDSLVSEAVSSIAEMLGCRPDVDIVDAPEVKNLDWPIGMSAAEYLKGLANLVGFYLWVDAEVDGEWVLHFRDPKNVAQDQEKKYKLTWGGDLGSLLSFEPEIQMTEKYTKIKIQAYSFGKKNQAGRIDEVNLVVDDNGELADPLFNDDLEEKSKPIPSADALKLYVGDHAFFFRAGIGFDDITKLKIWAKIWFNRNRENFIVAKGKTIGIENLRCRQEHTLSGLGNPYDGDYYFSRVRHVCDSSGYFCDFSARKIIKRED